MVTIGTVLNTTITTPFCAIVRVESAFFFVTVIVEIAISCWVSWMMSVLSFISKAPHTNFTWKILFFHNTSFSFHLFSVNVLLKHNFVCLDHTIILESVLSFIIIRWKEFTVSFKVSNLTTFLHEMSGFLLQIVLLFLLFFTLYWQFDHCGFAVFLFLENVL